MNYFKPSHRQFKCQYDSYQPVFTSAFYNVPTVLMWNRNTYCVCYSCMLILF